MPSAISCREFVTTQVGIANSTIDEEAGILNDKPIHVCIQSRLTTLGGIAVSGVQYMVVEESILFNAIARVTIAQIEVHHKSWRESIIDE